LELAKNHWLADLAAPETGALRACGHTPLNKSPIGGVQCMNGIALSTMDDAGLVKLARRGRLDAFEELVARHRDKLYARAFSLTRNEDDALELSQTAWVRGWQRLKQFQGDAGFATWMTRIVINLCLDHLRRQQRQRTLSLEALLEAHDGVEPLLPATTMNPTEGLEHTELRRLIDGALGRLTEDHRTVLVLHEFEEMEYKDIAQAMGCSTGTVMSRLFYARRKMAALLADLRQKQ